MPSTQQNRPSATPSRRRVPSAPFVEPHRFGAASANPSLGDSKLVQRNALGIHSPEGSGEVPNPCARECLLSAAWLLAFVAATCTDWLEQGWLALLEALL